jgi:hypothetical protein
LVTDKTIEPFLRGPNEARSYCYLIRAETGIAIIAIGTVGAVVARCTHHAGRRTPTPSRLGSVNQQVVSVDVELTIDAQPSARRINTAQHPWPRRTLRSCRTLGQRFCF